LTNNENRARELSKLKKAELIDRLLELESRDRRGEPSLLSLQNDVAGGKDREAVNRRLATIFETSVDAMIGTNPESIITDWNPAAETLYGYSAEEVVGKSISVIVPPELWKETRPKILKIADDEIPEPIEVVRRRKDGALIKILLTISPIKNARGEIVALSTINRDITEARVAQEALIRSEEILRAITDNSPSIIYLKDRDSNLLKVNKAYGELYGVAESEVIGQRGDNWLGEVLTRELLRQDQIVLTTGKPHDFEFEFVDSAGDTHYMHSVKFPVIDKNGQIYGTGGISTDITQYKLAERALAQSEARLNAIFDNAPIGLAVYDKDLHYVKVNPALAEINGLSVEDHVGRYLGDVIKSSLISTSEDAGRPVKDGSTSFVEVDVSGETKSSPGVRRHWIVSRFPIPAEDDSMGSIGAVVFEITDRKEAEEALRISEQRLRDIVETGTDWLWETDSDLRFTWVSNSERETLGQPEEFYIGRKMDELGPGEGESVGWDRQMEVLKNRVPFRDYPVRRKLSDGLQHHLLISGNSVFASDGAFKGYRGTGRDITTEIEAKEQSLRVEERFLRAIDSSAEGLVLFDSDERIVVANRTFLDTALVPGKWWRPGEKYEDVLRKIMEIGVSIEQYVGRPEDWVRDSLARFREGGEPYEFRHANGRWRRVHYERLQDGGAIARFQDITALKQREETLRKAQKMEAVGQLTGGVAHEFNNLLMVIVGNLEMSMASAPDDQTQKYLSTAMRGAMRGAKLTRQLLAFSRKQELNLEPVDLNGLVAGMREMLQRTLGETVSVETDLADSIWPIFVDAGQVEGALLNLSLNAFDAMPGGGRIVIRTSNRPLSAKAVEAHSAVDAGDFVTLEVTDDGDGIPPEVLDRVFEPFFTTKDVGEGTGLGLSMVHGFVEQSGGFVEIESKPDHGTKILINLPRADSSARTDIDNGPETNAMHSTGTTVLVVEDDPDVRDLVVLLLTELGCTIVEAEDGHAALRQLDAREDIELLFTDVVLPHGMSGPDVAREAVARRPDLKIVFTSGYPEQELGRFGPGDEKHRIIRKPYRKAELAEMLSDIMDQ